MSFVVHTGSENIHFFRKGDIFVADFRPILLGHQDSEFDGNDDLPGLVSDDSSDDEDPKDDVELSAIAQVNTVEKWDWPIKHSNSWSDWATLKFKVPPRSSQTQPS